MIEELNYFPEIKDTDHEFEFRLLNKEYKLAEPPIKERDAVYQSNTYSSDLYIPAQLAQKKKKKNTKANCIYWKYSFNEFSRYFRS